MIDRIEIRGLGPHTHTTLDLDGMGVSTLTGPSEVGKSTAIEAVCFALWGQGRNGKALDIRAIRDGHDEVRVDLTLHSGTTLTRTLTRSEKGRGRTFRQMTRRDGSTEEYRIEKDWLAALRWMGARITVLRTILVPLSWLPLAASAGGGRALRDLLDEALPTSGTKQEIIAEIMSELGFKLGKNDPINQTDAADLRRRCRQRMERAKGKLVGLTESRDELQATPERARPSEDQITDALNIVRVEALWAAGDAGRARADEARRAHSQASERADAWDARLAALGDRPESDASIEDLRRARDEAAAIHREAARRLAILEGEHRTLTAARKPRKVVLSDYVISRVELLTREAKDAKAAMDATSDVCPTCERPGWDGAVAAATAQLEAAHGKLYGAELALQADIDRLTGAEEERQRSTRVRLEQIEKVLGQARADVATAAELVERSVAAVGAAAGDSAVRWDAERRALGDRPSIPPVVWGPKKPIEPRPSADEVGAAKAVLFDLEHAEGAALQLAADLAMIERQLASAGEVIAEYTLELERLEALVAAVRREPSESVRRQLGARGDLGPVSLELGEKGGAAVLVDGRPWHLASTGRQVVADVWLRAGLRRAVGRPKTPIAIDQTQDVGGQVLPAPAPCILLTTTDGPALTVESVHQ